MGCGAAKILTHKRKRITTCQNLIIHPSTFVIANPKSFQDIYKVGKILGSGSFGEVRKVIHKQNNEIRAVKIFRKDIVESPHVIEKLFEEIQILKQLDHPNIIRLYEFFEDNKRCYIVMEHCSGGELFDEILKRQCFKENTAAAIIYQIISAIAYLHSKNIVHRDLKPENILLEEKGDVLNIKLIDFGAAVLKNPNSSVKETIGTAYYIAPEVIKGTYSEKCDMWSVGVIMFILLAGYPPFDGQDDEEILSKIKKINPNLSASSWREISDEGKDLIMSLFKQENQRLSAIQALNHDWFKIREKDTKLRSDTISSAMNNLKAFSRSSKLREAVSTFIASQCLTVAETRELRKVFQEMDTNGDGKLSRDELLIYFSKELGESEATEEVDKILSQVDSDNNGFVDYTEFLKASVDRKLITNKMYLKRAFDYFDKDGNGSISASELKQILTGKYVCEDEVWTEIIKEVDENEDGEIDINEFESIILAKI